MLGEREPEIYGTETLADIEAATAERAAALGFSTDFRQTNSEAELIGWLHATHKDTNGALYGIIINGAAFTHTSVALLDALLIVDIPVIEVHLSNPQRREQFRHHSYISPATVGQICGFGLNSYLLALDALAGMNEKK